MAIEDAARYQAHDDAGKILCKSSSLATFELPRLSDTKPAVRPPRLSASAYGFGGSSRGMGYTAASRRGLSRSGSSSSLVSPAGSSGSRCSTAASVSDPFRDLLRDLETNPGDLGTDVGKATDVEFTPSRVCKRELRRKANQARLDACDDLKRQVGQIKATATARQAPRNSVHYQPRPLKKELRRLKESIHRSQDNLLEDNASDLLAQKEIEFSPAFKAKLKRVASERDGLHPVADLFGTSPGKYFLSRLRRYREN